MYFRVWSSTSCWFSWPTFLKQADAPSHIHARKTKATMAANALAPVILSWALTAPLLVAVPLLQLCVKSVVELDWQSEPDEVELPELPSELLPCEPWLPTPLELSPGTLAAEAEAELELADEELAPASMSVPVASKLARTVLFLPLTTVLLVPATSSYVYETALLVPGAEEAL